MPPAGEKSVESFRGLVLQLRGRTGLTQRELATRVGVNVSSVQGWEAGDNYPGIASLKALIVVSLQGGGFSAGREREEARALWAAALRDAPRFRTPFDTAWFDHIVVGRNEPVQNDTQRTVAAGLAPPTAPSTAHRESWGEAPDVANFVGRVGERATLRRWVLDDWSRLVAVLGLGGIGKTLLTSRVARDLAPAFDYVFWRSLRDAPAPGEWLTEALRFLAPNDPGPSQGESAQVRRLLELLRDARCLLVLDNFETVLQPGGSAGDYRPGYERYGALIRQVAEAPHRSCLVVTSREEPAELGPLLGERGPVRTLELAGLGDEDGRALLSDKQLVGDEATWQALVRHCGGNGLALKIVAETTREVFDGSISDFLEHATAAPTVMVGGVRELLRGQVQRLSSLEQELLRRMAVEREPVGLLDLAAMLHPRIARAATLGALEGLRRRSLLERTEWGPLFVLHSVVLEYVTDQFVEDVAQELALGELDVLLRQPLLKATGKDYVRRSQERLVAATLLERLVESLGSARAAEQRLLSLLDKQRRRPVEEQGYGPGNLVNLLRLLRGDLRGADLSGLAIRQAYFQEVEAHGATFAGAHLAETVLGEAFSNPMSLALSTDGAYLAAGTADGEVCRWRLADRTLLAPLPGHTGQVMGVALSGDGRLVASGGGDGLIQLWMAERGRVPSILRGHTDVVRSVALTGDGRVIASGSLDGTVRLWAVDSGLPIAVLHGHTGEVYAVAISRDGRLVASSGVDGVIRLWDARSERSLAVLDGQAGGILGVALSGDRGLVASGGFDGTIRLWNARSERLLAALRGHRGLVMSVSMSGDGRLIASGGADGTVRLWGAEAVQHIGEEDRQPLVTLHGHTGVVPSVALSRDGRLVASGSLDGTIRMWETENGQPLAALQGHTGGILGVALSGDGRLAASGAVDGTVRIWEAESGRLRATLHGHTGSVRGVALSGDGRLLASGGIDESIRLWDVGRWGAVGSDACAHRRGTGRGPEQGWPPGRQRKL